MKFSDIKCKKDRQKMNLYNDPITVSHQWLSEVISEGMITVDATAGNGYDTVFLAAKVGDKGKVYAFDIQEAAINATEQRLLKAGLANRVNLIHAGHENLKSFVVSPINAMIFNLGYLPGSNKNIVTQAKTTLEALQAGMDLLLPEGLIVLTVYIGHPGGYEEWLELEKYLKSLSKNLWNVIMLKFLNRHSKTPFNIFIQRIDQGQGGVGI